MTTEHHPWQLPKIMGFVYSKLNLDLIRETDYSKRAQKMEEMGVSLDEEKKEAGEGGEQ